MLARGKLIKRYAAYTACMFFAFSLFFNCIADTANGQSFSQGYKKYTRGDFSGAQHSFQRALKKRANAATKAKIYKFLGISQYMLGNKHGSAASFKKAIKYNRRISINQSEVLDESVIAHFKAQKGGGGRRGSKISARAPKKALPSSSNAGRMKTTTLQIRCSVSNASIFIDGILAGRVNSSIEADPGKQIVDVSARGYKKKAIRVNVVRNRQNTYNIQLTKIRPKPKPKPKRVIAKKQPRRKKAQARRRAPVPKGDMFGGSDLNLPDAAPSRDLAGEFAADSSGYMPPPNPYQQQRRQQPAYQQPAYQQPAYQAPQPAYQPYAPAPYYPPPQPQTYYSPPPPPVPAEPAYSAYDPGGYDDPAPSPRKRRKKVQKSDKNLFLAIMPFGIGQFQNRSYMLGSAFAAAEVGALYFWFSRKQAADAAHASLATAVAQFKADQEAGNTTPEEEEKWQLYILEANAHIAALEKQSQYGLWGFVGLWGIGAIEAIINEPPPKRKKRKRKKYRGFSLFEKGTPQYAYADVEDAKQRYTTPEFNWNMGVIPNPAPENFDPAAVVSVKYKF